MTSCSTSIAATAGRAGVAVVLTGMGSDGAAGAGAVLRRGGLAIAQDEPSSAVFGMPKSAIDLGVTVVLSPEKIAACLLGLRRRAGRGDPVNPELAEIADLVRRETGIVLPAAREAALRAAVERAAPGLGAAAFAPATSDPAIRP